MLKRNWNWKKIRLFCHILSLVKFQLGRGRTPCPPPLGYAYVPSEENKKGVRKFSARFLAFSNEISTVQKIVLSSSRGQANFRGLEASRPRPRPRTWPSRPRPRPRTSKCVLEDVLEAKDVLEDSTSGWNKLQKKPLPLQIPGYAPDLHQGSVNAAKASNHAKFYNLSRPTQRWALR